MYGLEENPFPYSPVPDEDPEVYCGQEHVADTVSETASTLLGTGKSKHLVITGKYGNGKSHTLKYARSLVRDREDVVVGYVAQPGEGFLDIYHEFIYDIGFERLQEIAYEFLASITRKETDSNPAGASEMESLIDDGRVLLSDIVPVAVQRLSDITKFADFARAIVHMVYEDTNLYAWQWLTAEGIRYEQRKEMEIHSALDDDTMGVRAFTSFKKSAPKAGIYWCVRVRRRVRGDCPTESKEQAGDTQQHPTPHGPEWIGALATVRLRPRGLARCNE